MSKKKKKKVLVLTGGGDCPGLNAVIRGIYKRSQKEKEFEVIGSFESFNGIMSDPIDVLPINGKTTAGIHIKGGTILRTTNKGNPLAYPVQQEDGSWITIDNTDALVERIEELGIYAVISIGGDGSQKISQVLHQKGVNIIGVPKTIDNDLSATDVTFGFGTAVQIATDSFDKLVTTAESHHRVMIMEVMGRDAGWIALHTAIAGGAEICLIPEIPYDLNVVLEKINKRYKKGRGFVNIVISEGAKRVDGEVFTQNNDEIGYENRRLGGVAYQLADELKAIGCEADIRVAVLGHIQRGGTPIAFDRLLATMFGVRAFEMVLDREFGRMVSYKGSEIVTESLKSATKAYNFVDKDSYMVVGAKNMGVCFGDSL